MSYNETLKWTFGLISSAGKYLTAEAFGYKVNAAGKNLMKKQIFTLEQEAGKPTVSIKTCMGKYLSANEKGELTAQADEKGANEQWTVLAQSDGRWVFQGPHGYYFGGSGDNLSCFAREYGETEMWTIHLAMHPQVAMKNLNRDRYVHFEDNELRVNEIIPWGDDAMVMLEFHSGKYAIRACNRAYLSHDGTLTSSVSDKNLFILEFFESKLAFKTSSGKYLQAYGGTGKLCVRRDEVGKDELFLIEDSHPQVHFIGSNGLYASNSQSEETKCSVPIEKVGDNETYQMEFQDGKWAFRNNKALYWSIAGGSTVTAKSKTRGDNELFSIEWKGANVSIKCNNGKYISMKPNGSLVATGASGGATETFTLNLINRPQLVLRNEHGFLASKGRDIVVCNSQEPEVFQMEVKDGRYIIKGSNGKFFRTDSDGSVSCTGDVAEQYTIQLLAHSRLAIKGSNGSFFKAENSGNFKAVSSSAGQDELFEF